jgi:SAM-dependent methyltransferase
MSDQAHFWSQAAQEYEQEFIDPDLPGVQNPLRATLARLASSRRTVADLGCGIGPLLPFLAERFPRVLAVDFAPGMLARARERCQGHRNVEFLQGSLTDLRPLINRVHVAVAVNSLVLPDIDDLDKALAAIAATLRRGGHFVGIVPAMDGVQYFTMLLLDRARANGLPQEKARQNAAYHAEHTLYDFAFNEFRYKGLRQHFWHPFEIRYRLRRAGFRQVHLEKVRLSWQQFGCGRDFADQPPPWDWFFHARSSRQRDHGA